MKSKLLTKKSLVAVILILCLFIGLSYTANNTIVSARLKEMAHRKEYASQISQDGLYYISYAPDKNGNKIGSIQIFIGNDYMIESSEVPQYCNGTKVISIKDHAFANCKYLKEIYIPSSITYIEKTAFDGTKNLTMYVETDSCAEQFAKDNNIKFEYYTSKSPQNEDGYSKTVSDKTYKDFTYSIYYDQNSPCCAIKYHNPMGKTDVVIPSKIDDVTVTTIVNESFLTSGGVKTVTIPDTVNKIGENVFPNSQNFLIRAKKTSYAYQYATAHHIKFEEIS